MISVVNAPNAEISTRGVRVRPIEGQKHYDWSYPIALPSHIVDTILLTKHKNYVILEQQTVISRQK